jgi:putative ABC transport system permease protein
LIIFSDFTITQKIFYASISPITERKFCLAMDALRSNMLRTLLLLGVTIGIFSIYSCFAAVDSLDRKISKDLSGLDKNTIYLMKFSLGPLKSKVEKRTVSQY